MQPKPIIYCETNWIVSLVLQHHQHHQTAKNLLERAKNGDVDLRCPETALIEAPRPIDDEIRQFPNSWIRFLDQVQQASQNGFNDFDTISQKKDEIATITKSYITRLQRNKTDVLRSLAIDAQVKILSNHPAAVPKFTDIRGRAKMPSADTVDFYILAQVLADRAQEASTRTAILLSLDQKAFDPNGGKVDEQFYKDHYLAWCSSFNLEHAQLRWNEWFDPSNSIPFNATTVEAVLKLFEDYINDVKNPVRRTRFEQMFHKSAHVHVDKGSNLIKPNQLHARLMLKSWRADMKISDGSPSPRLGVQKIVDCQADLMHGNPERHRFVIDLWFDGTRYWCMRLFWNPET